MTSAPAVAIGSPRTTSLPKCSPHLMPFHIAHTGPAPISTYFMPKVAPPPDFGAKPALSLPVTEAQVLSESQTTVIAETEGPVASSSSTVISATSSTSTIAVDTQPESRIDRHFAAAFRGRAMRGLLVDVPQGYSGIVLQSPDPSAKATPAHRPEMSSNSKTLATRSTRYAKHDVELIEQDESEDELMDDLTVDDEPLRVLEPTASFSAFTIWNPDIPVNEAKDEYLRSLTEWTQLAAEVR